MVSLRIPYVYEYAFLPARKRNMKRATFAAETTVEVREADVGESVLVARIAHGGRHEYDDKISARAGAIDGRGRELRWFDGQLYLESGSAETLRSTMEVMFSKARQGTPFGSSSIALTAYETKLWSEEEVARDNGWVMQETSHRDRELKANDLARRASKLVIFDGIVFEAVAEPYLTVKHSSYEAPRLHLAGFDRDSRGRKLWGSKQDGVVLSARLHEMDELAARASKTLADPIEIDCQVEVLRPEFLRRCFDAAAFNFEVNAATHALYPILMQLPAEAGAAAIALKEALDFSDEAPTDALLSALRQIAALNDPSAVELDIFTQFAAERGGAGDGVYSEAMNSQRTIAGEIATARAAALNALAVVERADPDRLLSIGRDIPTTEHRFGSAMARIRPALDVEEIADFAFLAGVDPAELLQHPERILVARRPSRMHTIGEYLLSCGLCELDETGEPARCWALPSKWEDQPAADAASTRAAFEAYARDNVDALSPQSPAARI